MSRRPARTVVMNGTERPIGIWRLAGIGPFEWILSHRWFLRAMGAEAFQSIYTPKPRPERRKTIPSLDGLRRRAADEGVPF